MSHVIAPVTFKPTGTLQTYLVITTGNYTIAAAGAQGGAGASPGGRGAAVQGTFYLREGELLNLIIGAHGGPGLSHGPERAACGGGGGGGTYIWKSTPSGSLPPWPLLVAGGGGGGGSDTGGLGRAGTDGLVLNTDSVAAQSGYGGITDPCRHFGGGGGAGWFGSGTNGPGPIFCRGGNHWEGGKGIAYGPMGGGDGGFGGGGGGGFLGYASGGGAGYSGGYGGGQEGRHLDGVTRSSGGSSYNSGRYQTNVTGARAGHGVATISFVTMSLVVNTSPLMRSVRVIDHRSTISDLQEL